MFERHARSFGQAGGGGGGAMLAPAIPPATALRPGSDLLDGVRDRLSRIDLVVDLGARIGSGEWFRGAITCTALCWATWSLAPELKPLAAPAAATLPESQWQEARALGFAPLAYGADTGRRMAANDLVQPLVDTPERPSIDLVATLGQGDGFARVLERAGVADDEAGRVADMVADAVALGDIAAGTRIAITLGRRDSRSRPRPLDHLDFRARFDLRLAVARVDGGLRLQRLPIAVDETPLRIQGRVGAGLYLAARAAGAPAKAVEAYIKALATRMSVGGDVRGDDRFDIIVEHRRAATGETQAGGLLYAGLDQGKRRTQLLKWTVAGKDQWFEASGVGEKRGVMRMPVLGRLTSSFGMRFHPLLGYSRMHQGMDIGAPAGAPIVAATDGTVSFAGWHGGHGNYVMVKHGGGMATAYAHMSRIAARAGERVSQGEIIGYVGSTGLSTGPHLHYEVWKDGRPINPGSVSFVTTSQLAGADLANFRAKLARLMTVPAGARAAMAKADEGLDKSAEAKAEKPKRG